MWTGNDISAYIPRGATFDKDYDINQESNFFTMQVAGTLVTKVEPFEFVVGNNPQVRLFLKHYLDSRHGPYLNMLNNDTSYDG